MRLPEKPWFDTPSDMIKNSSSSAKHGSNESVIVSLHGSNDPWLERICVWLGTLELCELQDSRVSHWHSVKSLIRGSQHTLSEGIYIYFFTG